MSEFLALLERLVRSKQNCAKNFEAKCSVRHSPLPEAERSVWDALGFRECLFLFRDGGDDDRIWEHRAFNPNWQAFYARIQLDRHPLFRNFNGTGRKRFFGQSLVNLFQPFVSESYPKTSSEEWIISRNKFGDNSTCARSILRSGSTLDLELSHWFWYRPSYLDISRAGHFLMLFIFHLWSDRNLIGN